MSYLGEFGNIEYS